MKNRNVDFGIKTFILKNNLSDNKIYRVINNFSKKVILANQHGDLLTVNLAHTNLTKLGIDKIIVGDYVSYSPIEGKITKVYPRDNILSKVTSSAEKSWHVKSQKQLLASNVDEIWVKIGRASCRERKYIMNVNVSIIIKNVQVNVGKYIFINLVTIQVF